MVLGYTVNYLFQHPVEKVIDAHLNSHNQRQDIIEVKQVEHQYDVDGLEYLKRVITALNPLPTIIQKVAEKAHFTCMLMNLFCSDKSFSISGMDKPEIQTEEELWIDEPSRRYWIRNLNVSFSESITIQKNSTFVPDPHNPDWTCFEQAGAADMSNLGFVGKALELLYKNVMENEVRQNITLMEEMLDKK